VAESLNAFGTKIYNTPKAYPTGSDLTRPKPDIYLGYKITNSRHEQPYGFSRDSSVQNFSLGTLVKLIHKGLVCIPTTGVRKYLEATGRQLENQLRGSLNGTGLIASTR